MVLLQASGNRWNLSDKFNAYLSYKFKNNMSYYTYHYVNCQSFICNNLASASCIYAQINGEMLYKNTNIAYFSAKSLISLSNLHFFLLTIVLTELYNDHVKVVLPT